jgi:hypothetical protein
MGIEMVKAFFAIVFTLAYAGAAVGQPAPTQRIAGTVERVEGRSLSVKPADGAAVTVELAERTAVFDVSKAALADLKPGSFIGVGAMPLADGSQRAIQVTIFAESQRGTGEGHRPWNRPNSTMTNGTVDATLASVDGQVLTVKYKGGEKKIVVPPDAAILIYSTGDIGELKPGVHVAFARATKKADGVFEADRVNVGRGEMVPR